MSAAKELLRQEKERFISVYELVNLLARKQGLGLEDAAKVILKVLDSCDTGKPLLVKYVSGCKAVNLLQARRIDELLCTVAKYNDFEVDYSDEIPF